MKLGVAGRHKIEARIAALEAEVALLRKLVALEAEAAALRAQLAQSQPSILPPLGPTIVPFPWQPVPSIPIYPGPIYVGDPPPWMAPVTVRAH